MNRRTASIERQILHLFCAVLAVGGAQWTGASGEAGVKARNHLIIKDQYSVKEAMFNQYNCEFSDEDLMAIFPDRVKETDNSAEKETLKQFLTAFCIVHRHEPRDQTASAQEGLQQTLTKIVNTRSFALEEGEKNMAIVMQGVIACNQAAIIQRGASSPAQLQGVQRIRYCQARRRAQTVFNNLDLGRVDFSYESEPSNGGLLDLVQACYEGDVAPLGAVMALQCDEQSHLSNAEIEAAILQEYDIVSDLYLGGSGQITAMLNRKVSQVESMREKIEWGMEELQKNYTLLNNEYQRATTAISAQDKQTVKRKMMEYQQALAKAIAITKTLDGWKRSLLFDNETQINYVEVLTQKQGVVADQKAAIRETSSLLAEANGNLKSRADPDAAKRHVLFNLCRIHYCEHQLPSLFPIRFTPLEAACTEELNFDNPLCSDQGQARIAQLCSDPRVNFPSRYMPPATRAEGIECRSIVY